MSTERINTTAGKTCSVVWGGGVDKDDKAPVPQLYGRPSIARTNPSLWSLRNATLSTVPACLVHKSSIVDRQRGTPHGTPRSCATGVLIPTHQVKSLATVVLLGPSKTERPCTTRPRTYLLQTSRAMPTKRETLGRARPSQTGAGEPPGQPSTLHSFAQETGNVSAFPKRKGTRTMRLS